MGVRLGFDEETFALELLHDALAGFEAVEPLEVRGHARRFLHPRVLGHDQRLVFLGPRAIRDVEIVGVVGRRDFQHAGAEGLVHSIIGRDGDRHAGQWDLHLLALQGLVAAVFRIEDQPDVAEHRFRTRGRHCDRSGAVLQRILDVVQIPLRLVVLGLFVR